MASLKKEMGKGVFWSAIQKYSSMFISIAVTMVLARIFTPEQFGVIAISTVLINFLSIFSTMGIGPAIIQRKDLDIEDYNNIFSFTLIVGLVLSLLFFCLAKPIARFYNDDDLIPICRILTISLFFASVNMVPNALMSKNKRFKELAIRTFILSVISGVFSIIAALLGFGIYSLLITPVINSIGIFLFNRRFYPVIISRNFSLSPIKKIYSYSVYQFSFEISNFFANNLDKLLIGKLISSADLGYYDKSHHLMKLPTSMLTSVVSPVIQPFMSEHQDNMKQISDSHNAIVKIISTFSFPVAAILFFTGPEIIEVFFGKGWERAIPCFQIFCLSLPTQMILSTSGAFWQSTNSTKLLFEVGLLNTVLTLGGYIISSFLFGSIEAVAFSFVFSCVIAFFITYWLMYKTVFNVSLGDMLILLINPLVNVLLLVVAYLFINKIHGNVFVLFVIKIVIGIVITLLFVQVSGRYDMRNFFVSLNKNR